MGILVHEQGGNSTRKMNTKLSEGHEAIRTYIWSENEFIKYYVSNSPPANVVKK